MKNGLGVDDHERKNYRSSSSIHLNTEDDEAVI